MTENPPAFPRVLSHEEGDYGKIHYATHPGMSLRDWFAGQALPGLIALDSAADTAGITQDAYAFADAMLAERNKATSNE